MIGLDTNVLVRYLTQDDPRQARKAAKFLEEGAERGESFFITSVAMCELVWVLESSYGLRRTESAKVLEQLLRTAQFRFENTDQLWLALGDYRRGKGDFADYLIGRLGSAADCEQTATFDRSLGNNDLFLVL